jgi:hypothetical protein
MKWPKWDRSWIPGILVWSFLLGSLALNDRYPWIDGLWYGAWTLLLIVVSVHAVIHIFRHRGDTEGVVGYRYSPPWLVKLFGGEVGSRKTGGTIDNRAD